MATKFACTSLLVAVAVGGCSSQLEPVGGDGDSDGGPPMFIPGDVQLAFDNQCVGAGCHDAASNAGMLSLEDGDSLAVLTQTSTTGEPLVVIGDVMGSYMAIKMLPPYLLPEGARVGSRMPFGRDPGHPDNAVILGWIAGAELPMEPR